MKKDIIILLASIAMAAASCTGCRVSKDLHKSTVDSTSYFRDQSVRIKDSLNRLDSVHKEVLNSWLEFGAVFQEECPPCDTVKGTGSNDHHTGPLVDPLDYMPTTKIETRPDGTILLQTRQRLKALNLNYSTLASRYDSVRKVIKVKDSTIMDLEKKVELSKKEKTLHIEKEWYIPWWIWLIVAGLSILWIRKQFF
ncbi:MAG: hypothetical protein J0M30_14865 [Chitinophagales bacterium]|nr:hypothetical protein [Chitinophagales bacterium]